MEEVQGTIRLIASIENYPVLYDHNADGYHSRTEQEKAWLQVSHEVQESVSSCKEKWKNIRGSLSRHLRQQQTEAGKKKKAYYLAKYLDFLIPFTKTRTYSIRKRPSPASETSCIRTFGTLDYIYKEKKCYSPEDSQSNDEMLYMESSVGEQPHYMEPNIKMENPEEDERRNEGVNLAHEGMGRMKRKNLDPLDMCTLDYVQPKQPKYEEQTDPDLSFFKSLLPDVKQMSRTQKNRFKVTIINSLEAILSGAPPFRTENQPFSDCSSSHQH